MKIRVDFLVAIAAEHRFVEAQLIGDVEVLDDEYLYQIVQCDGSCLLYTSPSPRDRG